MSIRHIAWSIGIIAVLSVGVYFSIISINLGAVWWWTWRIMLTLGLVGLLVWALWTEDRRTDMSKHFEKKWLRKALGWTVSGLFVFFVAWPWLGTKWNELLVATAKSEQSRATTQAEFDKARADINRQEVATESRPVRVEPRGEFDRVLVGPVEYASYKLTYPSGDTTVTMIHIKGTGHFEMPFQPKWMEYRPFDTDSVTFSVHQREQR